VRVSQLVKGSVWLKLVLNVAVASNALAEVLIEFWVLVGVDNLLFKILHVTVDVQSNLDVLVGLWINNNLLLDAIS
jgi:hypothetical protein